MTGDSLQTGLSLGKVCSAHAPNRPLSFIEHHNNDNNNNNSSNRNNDNNMQAAIKRSGADTVESAQLQEGQRLASLPRAYPPTLDPIFQDGAQI